MYHGRKVSNELKNQNEWLQLFDVIIVGSCKPSFLIDPKLNLLRVNPIDGSLRNTDCLYEIDALGVNGIDHYLEKGNIFQGGNWIHLQKMLGITSGDQIMYVGDNLHGDVLRSKMTLGWRTAMIVPELKHEMEIFNQQKDTHRKITELRKLRDDLGVYCDNLRFESLKPEVLEQKLEGIKEDDKILKKKLKELTLKFHSAFHPQWGAMFLTGYQESRFAYYVKNYSCIYTSKATNLGQVSVDRSFRTTGNFYDTGVLSPSSR